MTILRTSLGLYGFSRNLTRKKMFTSLTWLDFKKFFFSTWLDVRNHFSDLLTSFWILISSINSIVHISNIERGEVMYLWKISQFGKVSVFFVVHFARRIKWLISSFSLFTTTKTTHTATNRTHIIHNWAGNCITSATKMFRKIITWLLS
jgi:hypothetical protein